MRQLHLWQTATLYEQIGERAIIAPTRRSEFRNCAAFMSHLQNGSDDTHLRASCSDPPGATWGQGNVRKGKAQQPRIGGDHRFSGRPHQDGKISRWPFDRKQGRVMLRAAVRTLSFG